MHALSRPDRHPRSSGYDAEWILALDRGPHPLWQLEDLLPQLRLRPGDRVLDLACGGGASSVFLVREAQVEVVAVDRTLDPELDDVFQAAGVAGRVTAVRADARDLPFGDDEFDAIVCIDAFEYFGTDVHLLPGLLRVLRPGGAIAISTPALAVDPYLQAPPDAVTAVVGWEAAAWHTPDWWRRHWELTGLVTEVSATMQPGGRDDWTAWARAGGEAEDGPLLLMLSSMGADQIGFALVSAIKTPVD